MYCVNSTAWPGDGAVTIGAPLLAIPLQFPFQGFHGHPFDQLLRFWAIHLISANRPTNTHTRISQHSQECEDPRRRCFLWLGTMISARLIPNKTGFQDWNVSVTFDEPSCRRRGLQTKTKRDRLDGDSYDYRTTNDGQATQFLAILIIHFTVVWRSLRPQAPQFRGLPKINIYLFRHGRGYNVLWSACLFVCLSVRSNRPISNIMHTSKFHKIFFPCYAWPWLGPPLTAMRYGMYFRFCWWSHALHNRANG